MKKCFILCGCKRLLIVLEEFLGKKRCIFGEGSSGRSSSEEISVISIVLTAKGNE